jgi:hypothetical protein
MATSAPKPPTIPYLVAQQRLNVGGLTPGPNTGQGGRFMIWLCPKGFPQMINFADDLCTEVWEKDVEDALKSV